MSGRIRIGIVGMGAAGWAFVPAIRGNAAFELAAVAEPAADVREMLGLADRARVVDLFEATLKGDMPAALAELRAQYDGGADPVVLLNDLAEFTHLVTRLKLVPVDDEKAENGAGPIAPSPDTIKTGTYQPLSRPVFIYVSKKAADRQEVKRFVEYYLKNAETLVREVNYVGLGPEIYGMVTDRFTKRHLGSVFSGQNTVGVTIDQLLSKERAQ